MQPKDLLAADLESATEVNFVRAMFARIARCYDFMNRLMTLGRDQAWRRYVARQTALPQGGLTLDVATGTADLALALARHYPHGHVVGVDFCPEMIGMGRVKVAKAEENPRIRFVIGDALQLPFTDSCFDAVTSGFALRNVANIGRAFTEMRRVVKAGGRVVCLEIARPTLPIFRQLFHVYFYQLVPLLGRIIAGQGEAYHYLPHSLTHFLSPEELKAVMERVGLSQVWYRRLMLGTVAVHVGFKGYMTRERMVSMTADKAITLGHPSYVWRAGQERRLEMVRRHASLEGARILDVGCGLGMYVRAFRRFSDQVYGVDVDPEKVAQASQELPHIQTAPAEELPFAEGFFDVVLLHEVLEHVDDDRQAVHEAHRVTRVGGRIVVFAPNRLWPWETHGLFWRGQYRFGNIPLVNYLPNLLRNRLAGHVRVYTGRGLRRLFHGLPARVLHHGTIYPGFDNLAARRPPLARLVRGVAYTFEKMPLLRSCGLSHFLVVQKERM